MPTFHFNKLVRGKLPEIYDGLNQKITFRRLIGKELLSQLRAKIVEEVSEIPIESDDRVAIIDEIGDAEQGLEDMKTLLKISDDEVEAARLEKLERKGGFTDGIFVETIELEDDDTWVDYYRKEPNKYPEVQDDYNFPKIEKGIYRHNKTNKLYEVLGVSLDTETNIPRVIYRPLYESEYEMFSRPYTMFIEMVELDGVLKPRFELKEPIDG